MNQKQRIEILSGRATTYQIIPRRVKLFLWTHVVLPMYKDYIEDAINDAQVCEFIDCEREHEDRWSDMD